jgi:topoisomerase IA-like protein
MNGLIYAIQDEMNMVTIRNVEDAYQISLNDEEKLAQKKSQRGRGRSQS